MGPLKTVWRDFLKRPDLSGLPPRVRAAIAEREWANELLLRSIQLTIILIFCFIYTISPKTYPDDTVAPVPYVLGAYLVLAVIGLIWGWMREPPDWAGYVSILFDFCLLYGLMISFHIQYGQPASFILKAPSLLYVFIFIAIRALRFHPKFVLMAGGVAALGWAIVIVYVTHVDPANNMLTHSYIHYLTSNSILIGAEVDKILSISFVTIILAIAVNGSSNLLVTAVAERSAAADFSRFFDSSVAEGIRSAEALEAGRGEKRFATILNVDLRGFTGLADRLDADSVMAVLSAYQGRVIPLVQQHGGIIDKFMGDGIMASFGIGDVDGEVEPGCEANAVRAAEAILLDAERWAGEVPEIAQAGGIEVGIGIASGTVNWGAVGREDRLEMTVIGPAVNLSAKLEKHNKKLASRCICDAETWAAACGQGYDGLLGAEIVHTHIEGTGRNVEIAVLTPNPVPIAPMPQGEPVGRT
ncbi:MAG: adenylate/guanylate cyclase domain-containing protein [Salaquimonas sp.]|jgi:adenylate cyclase|nr:adenylate/guanylate cyclase domain-containing protein [Salaquimonas sp.]